MIERDGIPLVYWYSVNLGAYAYASGMGDGLKYKGRVEKMVRYVYKTERKDGEESHWGFGPRHWHDRLERAGGSWHIVDRREVDILAGD